MDSTVYRGRVLETERKITFGMTIRCLLQILCLQRFYNALVYLNKN
jgi:hypothetical protein